LEPVEMGRRLARELDLHRTIATRGVIVPNHFTLALASADRQRFATFEDALVQELAGYVAEHARAEGYHFLGPVAVELETDANLGTGSFLVASDVRPSDGGSPRGTLVLPDGTRITVGEDPIVIGRLPECDIVLAAEGRTVVVDLGSTNGTKVNGAGVAIRALEDGDVITVGITQIRFEGS
jgi:hypothetical protein